MQCKKCGSERRVLNGFVRGKQRYKCKDCGCNFVEGDARAHVPAEVKALAMLLYGRGKASYGFIAKLFGVTPVSVMRWLKEIVGTLPQPVVDSTLREIEFDEMRHFLNKKKRNCGYGARCLVLETKLLDGLWATVVLTVSGNSLNVSRA